MPQAQGVGSGARPLCAQVAARGLSCPAWERGDHLYPAGGRWASSPLEEDHAGQDGITQHQKEDFEQTVALLLQLLR